MRILLVATALVGLVFAAFLLFGPPLVQPRPAPVDVLAGQGFSGRYLVPEAEAKRVFDSVRAKATSINKSAKCKADIGVIFNIVGVVAGLLVPFATTVLGTGTAGTLTGRAKILVASLGLVAGIGAGVSGLLVAETAKLDKSAKDLKELMTSARSDFFAGGSRAQQQAVLDQLLVDLARF